MPSPPHPAADAAVSGVGLRGWEFWEAEGEEGLKVRESVTPPSALRLSCKVPCV